MRLALALTSLISLAACGHSHDDYATLMECVTDHTVNEGLTEVQGLATCLLDHIANPTWTTQAECEEFVAANGGYPASAVMACMIYFAEM